MAVDKEATPDTSRQDVPRKRPDSDVFAQTGVEQEGNPDTLRMLAEQVMAEYPGRWFYLTEEFEEEDRPDVGNVWRQHPDNENRATAVYHDTSRLAAEYIQEIQPRILLSLLDRIEELEREVTVWRSGGVYVSKADWDEEDLTHVEPSHS